MAKAQHSTAYRAIPPLLKEMREAAKLSQREVGKRMRRPQSFIYNCESANRRVDAVEFLSWCRACGVDPVKAFARLVERLR